MIGTQTPELAPPSGSTSVPIVVSRATNTAPPPPRPAGILRHLLLFLHLLSRNNCRSNRLIFSLFFLLLFWRNYTLLWPRSLSISDKFLRIIYRARARNAYNS